MAEALPLAPAPSLRQLAPTSSFVMVSTPQGTLPDMVGTKKEEGEWGWRIRFLTIWLTRTKGREVEL